MEIIDIVTSPYTILILFVMIFLSYYNIISVLNFVMYYCVPAIKMSKDMKRIKNTEKWTYYYIGIAFLTMVYKIFSIPRMLCLFLSFPLIYRDGALVALFAKIVLLPFYMLFEPLLKPFLTQYFSSFSAIL